MRERVRDLTRCERAPVSTMQTTDFRHRERLRVRWVEVDLQKVVFNGHYLTYFDIAVAGYWRATALPYAETMQQLGGDLFVRKATVEYFGPAQYDDLLEIGMRCARIGTTSIVFEGAVFRHGRVIASGELVYVYTRADAAVPQPVPDRLRDALRSFEAGDGMVTVRTGDGGEQGAAAAQVLATVGGPDPEDDAGAVRAPLYAVAYNRFDHPLATGRLTVAADGSACIDTLATRPAMRGGGLGRTVLAALVAAARSQGYAQVFAHVPSAARPLYASAGFVVRDQADGTLVGHNHRTDLPVEVEMGLRLR
jgi:YbgC/YbaW family acyl-CoA thioester hydrolase